MAGVNQTTSGWSDSLDWSAGAGDSTIQYQSDGTQGYIPEIWAGKLIERW